MTRVAIQGVTGSYSEEAVRQIFGSEARVLEYMDFDGAFAAVRSGDADTAVVPVENKIVGPISRPVELLRSNDYRILEKLTLQVRHVLSGSPGTEFGDVVSVRSHVEALKQCRKFFAANPQLTRIVGADTASSVKSVVAEKDVTSAAIGSRRAAQLYGAEILRENVADDIDNWTVFYLIGN